MISQGDLVYARPMRGVSFEPGDRFTVYRTLEPLKDPDTDEVVGIQHHIVGVVKIIETHTEFAIGTVANSYLAIEINDLLMPYVERSPKILLQESQEGLNGKIVAAQRPRISMYAKYFVVFIDKGFDDGVRVGQSYSVYYQEEKPIDSGGKETILLPPVDYAEILILRVEETTATAVVTYSEQGVPPGAKIRVPTS